MVELHRTVGMAVLSGAWVGCASAPKVYETGFQKHPQYSRAMNVLMAAGRRSATHRRPRPARRQNPRGWEGSTWPTR